MIYIYNLDRYFDYYMEAEGVKRDIPNFKYKINRYKEVWRKTVKKSLRRDKNIFTISSDFYQTFRIPYMLPGNCRYDLIIDVEKLKDIVKEIDLLKENDKILNKYFRGKDYLGKSGNIKFNDLGNGGMKTNINSEIMKQVLDFNIEHINKEYAKMRIDAKEPIICLDMEGVMTTKTSLCIVDGNHQSYEKLYLSNKDNIEVYIISIF